MSQGELDAADLIASFATGTYTVTRRPAAGDDGKGRKVPGSPSTFPLVASVQPASGRDLLRLPELRRSIETRVVYSATQLYVGAQGAAYESDLILIPDANGTARQFEVQTVTEFDAAVGYWRCIAQAVG